MFHDDRDDLKTYFYPPQPPPTAGGLTEGVAVPGLQAAITGLLSGVCAGILTAAFGWAFSPWLVGLAIFSLTALTSWLSYRGHWSWRLERILGIDLNRDGSIGPPEPEPARSVRIELLQDQGRQGDFIDLPATPQKLKALASGIINHKRQFALSLWVGNGQVFSRPEFENLRSVMIERHLLKWKNEGNPNQGVDLTPQGRAVLRYIASDQYQPTALSGEE